MKLPTNLNIAKLTFISILLIALSSGCFFAGKNWNIWFPAVAENPLPPATPPVPSPPKDPKPRQTPPTEIPKVTTPTLTPQQKAAKLKEIETDVRAGNCNADCIIDKMREFQFGQNDQQLLMSRLP